MKRTLLPALLCALLLSTSHASAETAAIPEDALVTYGYLQKELEALRQELLEAVSALEQKDEPSSPPSVSLPPLRPLLGKNQVRQEAR